MKAFLVCGSAFGNTREVAEPAAVDPRQRMLIHGDAARKITHALRACGADIIAEPMPFNIGGTKDPPRSKRSI